MFYRIRRQKFVYKEIKQNPPVSSAKQLPDKDGRWL